MHVPLCLFLLVYMYVCDAALVMFPCSTVAMCGSALHLKCGTTATVCVDMSVCVWGGGGREGWGGRGVYCTATCVLAVCIVLYSNTVIAALTSYRSATTAVCCVHGIHRHVWVGVGYKGDDSPQPTLCIPPTPHVFWSRLCVSTVVVSGSSTYQCH